MTACENLAIKIQELLGNKYKIVAFDDFSNEFLTEVQTQFGKETTLDRRAFAKYDGVDVGVVNISSPMPANVGYYYLVADYSIDFWVQFGGFTTSDKGAIVKHESTFFADMEALNTKVRNKPIAFHDGKRGRISMSEPYGNGTKDTLDGSIRKALHIRGRVALTDRGLFGGDTRYFLWLNGAWQEVETNTADILAQSSGDQRQFAGSLKPLHELVQQDYALSLTFDDSDNLGTANSFLRNVARNGTVDEVRVRQLYADNTERVYYSVPVVEYRSTRNEIGTYAVSFADKHKR